MKSNVWLLTGVMAIIGSGFIGAAAGIAAERATVGLGTGMGIAYLSAAFLVALSDLFKVAN